MKKSTSAMLRRQIRLWSRAILAALPAPLRLVLFRRLVDCEPAPRGILELKIADTQPELEACFALLHDAYVASGFMRPHPSGLRVTPYHALPTTTTLCAKLDGKVVGTLSIVREGVFGFPMQTAFDIAAVRAKDGRIAEISALAIHPRYRKTGGSILFPLMKFMYEYCSRYFDTRHLLIAVNPSKIEMYESLLFFRRIAANVVDRYDFANGAPAVGATLDLHDAPELFRRAYAHKPGRRNLHRYFIESTLPEIRFPARPWHTSNDPVLTPEMIDYFFNQRTSVFAGLDDRKKQLLHSIYRGPEWSGVLPALPLGIDLGRGLRRDTRYSLKCPASLTFAANEFPALRATIVELSAHGFQARTMRALRVGVRCTVAAELGDGVRTQVQAEVVRHGSSDSGQFFGFRVDEPDDAWRRCVAWLEGTPAQPASAGREPAKLKQAELVADPH